MCKAGLGDVAKPALVAKAGSNDALLKAGSNDALPALPAQKEAAHK